MIVSGTSPATPLLSKELPSKYSITLATVYSLPPNQRSCAIPSIMSPRSRLHLASLPPVNTNDGLYALIAAIAASTISLLLARTKFLASLFLDAVERVLVLE